MKNAVALLLLLCLQLSLFADLDLGSGHSLYLRSDGSLWGSGRNNFGQLMEYPNPNVFTPVKLVGGNVINFAAGNEFTLYVKDDGSAWGVGENSNGQLGQGNTFNSSTPYLIMSSNVTSVSAGGTWSAFLKDDGSLWTCGYNIYGQLGTGNTIDSHIPVMIESTGVVEVKAGLEHLVYRKADGSVWATGRNFDGQLGIGSSTDQSSPAQVFASGIDAIATGEAHSLFLSGNQLYASGRNSESQLGDESTTGQLSAIYTGQANIVAIFAGHNKSGWTDNMGDTYVVGSNGSSELGTGSSPVQTPHLLTGTSLNDLALGLDHILLENTNGLVKGQGQNTDGQLGSKTNPISNLTKANYPESYGSKSAVVVKYDYADFHVLQGIVLTYIITDSQGRRVENDDFTNLTITPTSSANILRVITGNGDGSYGVDAGAETVQARQGVVAVLVSNDQLESFSVSVSNDSALSNPATLTLESKNNVSRVKIEAYDNTTFVLDHDGNLYGSGQNSNYELAISTGTDQDEPVLLFAGNILDVSAGQDHTLFVTHSGELRAVGSNSFNQFGNTGFSSHSSPVQIWPSDVVAVSTAYNSSYFLLSNGDLYGIGENPNGQLGDGSTSTALSPVLISSNVIDFDAGSLHLMFVKNDGSLWGTGMNTSGQLGDGTGSDQLTPVQVVANDVSRVFSGHDSSFYTNIHGELLGFGRNDNGQLGLGHVSNELNPKLISDRHIVSVSGFSHSMFVDIDGVMYVTGYNINGELGDSTNSNEDFLRPEHENVQYVATGQDFTVFLQEGSVYGMGTNNNGELGNSDLGIGPFNIPKLTNIPSILGRATQLIVTSFSSELGVNQGGEVVTEIQDQYGNLVDSENSLTVTFAFTGNGHVFGVKEGFGDGAYGVIGGSETVQVVGGRASVVVKSNTIETFNVSFVNSGTLIDPSALSINTVTNPSLGLVAVGGHTTLFMSADGYLYGAGKNDDGQLADSSLTNQTSIVTLESGDVVDASVGTATTYYVKSDGSFWGVGQGINGQLGRGQTTDHSSPVEIISSSIDKVEAGNSFVLFRKDNGSLWGVGQNSNGQLGNGATVDISNPAQIYSFGIDDFSAGASHSLFLKSDGSAWAAGYNINGQLGDTTTTDSSSPVQVSGMSSNVIAVAAGHSHSLFLKDDGSAWGVGHNTNGQLGQGHNTDQSTPVQIFGGNIIKIYAGSYSSFFLKNDGSLWAVGQGINGEFGDGSSVDVNAPIQILATGVQSLASWENITLFLMEDGSVMGSGYETHGELGIGTSSAQNHYTRVATGYPQSSIQTDDADSYKLNVINTTFNPAQGTRVTIQVLDDTGALMDQENTLEFTLGVNNNAFIEKLHIGQGDGSYGVVAGSEVITVRGGQASFTLNNSVQETFTLSLSNNRGISGPVSKQFISDETASSPLVEAGHNASYYLTSVGELWGAGQNSFGQLGDGSNTDRTDPVLIYSSNILDVASGTSHTLVLKTDGSVWAFGENSFGQLGDGTITNRSTPVQIYSANVIRVWAGDSHSLFLLNNNELWGSGQGSQGQFGDGSAIDYNTPSLIATDVIYAAGGGSHTLFVKSDGSLWSCGYNINGQLGDGTSTQQNTAVRILSSGVVSCFAGQNHSFFIKTDGSLWGMGQGTNGQLGDGANVSHSSPTEIISSGVSFISAGTNHTLMIKEDGSLWAFGDGTSGQLGNGTAASESSPYEVESDGVISASAGSNFSIYLKNGVVYFMGYNGNGQLGDSSQATAVNYNTPVTNNFPNLVGSPTEVVVSTSPNQLGIDQQGLVKVEVLDNFGGVYSTDSTTIITFSLSGNGTIFGVQDGFGDGSYGVLGGSESIQVHEGVASVLVSEDTLGVLSINVTNDAGLVDPAATQIDIVDNPSLGTVAVGSHTTIFLNANGTLYGTGRNDFGQLGDGTITNRNSVLTIANDVIYASMGSTTTYYILNDGSLWGSGQGINGQLGRGQSTDQSTPVEIEAGSITRVDGGENYVIYLKEDGSLWGVGENSQGQIGDGGSVAINNPVQIYASGIVDFSTGGQHSLFVKDDGSAWATGYNFYGQLGDTTTTTRYTPVQVSGMSSNVIAVAAGQGHSLFLKDDGSVWGVGQNNYGQLGQGHVTDQMTPVQIMSANVVSIFAGSYTSFFLQEDGSLWAVGQNNNGEYGDGTSSDSYSPIQILASGVQSVSSWESLTLFLMDDGSVLGSGQESNGGLGINTTVATTHTARIATGYPDSQIDTIGADSYKLNVINTTFNPAQGTLVTIQVLDTNGDLIATENTLEFTLSVNGSAFIEKVHLGQGDGSYSVVAGSEVVTVRNGQASFTLNNSVLETFSLSISNNRGVSGPVSMQFTSDDTASSPIVEAGHNTSYYLTSIGELWGSGQNNFGQLGDSSNTDQTNPILIFSSNVLDVASGASHTLVLKTDGSVWAFGENSFGQLGDGTVTNRSTPVQIYGANVIRVWAGDSHSLFLLNNNELWGAGQGTQGQFGDGSVIDYNTPSLIATDVVYAAGGGSHTLFVKSDGSLWSCGYNLYGQLGDGTNAQQNTAVKILSSGVVSCFAGQNHSFFIKTDGSLWGMGQGTNGQLGDGMVTNYSNPIEILASGVTFVSPGTNHTLIIKDDGSLWSFGEGTNGQLGNVSATNENSPYQVESDGVISASAGSNFSLYLKNGVVYFMGYNGNGQLGDSSQATAMNYNSPVTNNFPNLVGSPSEVVISSIPKELGVDQQGKMTVQVLDNFGGVMTNDSTTQVTFHLSGNGQVYAVEEGFGDGSYGVIGGSETIQVINGVATILVSDDTVETLNVTVNNNEGLIDPSVAAIEIVADPVLGIVDVGSHNTIFMDATGHLRGAGRNDFGQLADSSLVDQTSVVTIQSSDVVDASTGSTTTYFVKTDGSLWGVGQGINGQLGRGQSVDENSPVEMETDSITRVEAGVSYVLYQKDDGSVWGVGMNSTGQIGNGGSVDINNPAQVYSSGILDFAAGGQHSLFVKDDGSAWSTGYNFYGQLGDTSTTTQYTPVQVNGMSSNVIAVAAGQNHSLFLKDDGSVWAVGQNANGQLGLGHTTDQNTPVQVFAANVTQIFAGSSTSFFMMNDGSLWATGEGLNGEFGDGSSVDVNSPTQILASGVQSVASWEGVTLFLMDDGRVWGSGYESNGEMGLGNSVAQNHYSRILTGYPQSLATAIQVVSYDVKVRNLTFNPAQGTLVTIRALDASGNLINTENALEFTLSSNASSYIESVVMGQGDGSYGVIAGTEVITTRNGRIRIRINDQVSESFTLSISNNRGVTGPSQRILISDIQSASPKVETGYNSSFYIKENGELWASGQNNFGQLGDGSTTDRQDPIMIYSGNVIDVASGQSHTLILMNDGSVWAAGENSFGQLGDGSNVNTSIPVQVYGANVIGIWAGENHSLFLLNNNELWGTGINSSGELGDGSTTDRSAPVLISSDVLDAAAGKHTLFVKTDGSLWASGQNSSYQLGDGSITSRSTPYQVESSGVAQVFFARFKQTSFYLKENGELWGMGEGTSGQLGDGLSVTHTTPMQLIASGVSSLAAGTSHTLIIKEDDSLWAFGQGLNGRLGDGTSSTQSSPVIVNAGNTSSISAGDNFSIFIRDELVYFMGSNFYGAAGNLEFGTGDATLPILTKFQEVILLPEPLLLGDTSFVTPTAINRGGPAISVMQWELTGGANIEVIDGISIEVNGDVGDLERFEILDVTAGNSLVYSGNTFQGNVVGGNITFTTNPITILSQELRQYELNVLAYNSTSMDNVGFSLDPSALTLSGGNVALGNVISSGFIPFVGGVIPPSNPVVLQSTSFTFPGNIIRGAALTPVFEWELVGGSNIEVIDGFNISVYGDVFDLSHYEILDVTSGTNVVYSGNTFDGNVLSGNINFFGNPQSLLNSETRRYQLAVSLNNSTSMDNLTLEIAPWDIALFGANVAQGNLVSSNVLHFEGGMTYPTIPVVLQSTSFTSPANLIKGGALASILEWELVGGANLEMIDGFEIDVLGDVFDLNYYEIVDVTSGNSLVYSGNAMNGNQASGNIYFTGNPQQLLSSETRRYQLSISVNEFTSMDNIEFELNPAGVYMSASNLVQGNLVFTGLINFENQSSGNMGGNVQGLDDASLVMSAGQAFLIDEGELFSKGRNHFGELGRSGDSSVFMSTNLINIISVDAGENHAIALSGNGDVYTWGSNIFHQSNASGGPEIVQGFGHAIWVGAGAYSSYLLNDNGQLFATGRNHKGQLGLGFTSISSSWTEISLPSGNIDSIDIGIEHVLMAIDGSLYGFGSNTFAQLNVDSAHSPTLIDGSGDWVDVAAGGFHSLALKASGNVYAWGKNTHGQLGLGFSSSRVGVPSLIVGLNQIVSLSAGYDHSVFLDDIASVRSLYVCGSDRFSQTGTIGASLVPVLMSGLPSIDEVQTGPYSIIFKHDAHLIEMIGLDTDGTQYQNPLQVFDTDL